MLKYLHIPPLQKLRTAMTSSPDELPPDELAPKLGETINSTNQLSTGQALAHEEVEEEAEKKEGEEEEEEKRERKRRKRRKRRKGVVGPRRRTA